MLPNLHFEYFFEAKEDFSGEFEAGQLGIQGFNALDGQTVHNFLPSASPAAHSYYQFPNSAYSHHLLTNLALLDTGKAISATKASHSANSPVV